MYAPLPRIQRRIAEMPPSNATTSSWHWQWHPLICIQIRGTQLLAPFRHFPHEATGGNFGARFEQWQSDKKYD